MSLLNGLCVFGSRRLEQNAIKVIPAGAFSPYKKLRRMWVDEEMRVFCTLSTIHKNFCCRPLSSLCWPPCCAFCVSLFLTDSLVLCFCFLFPSPFVFHRDLSNNQISELASDAFQGLRSLNSLWVLCGVFILKLYFFKHSEAPLWGRKKV